ncbi:MAG: hypothetical protein KME57_34955 [Scytonema hyalinum WJT4-NPBG1]|nr:hypothetical protein [Scytonema hyalinum WJT4-NPBG1]
MGSKRTASKRESLYTDIKKNFRDRTKYPLSDGTKCPLSERTEYPLRDRTKYPLSERKYSSLQLNAVQ